MDFLIKYPQIHDTIRKEHSSEMWVTVVVLENWIDSYNDYEALNMAFSFDMFHLSAHQKWHKTGDEIKNKKINIIFLNKAIVYAYFLI